MAQGMPIGHTFALELAVSMGMKRIRQRCAMLKVSFADIEGLGGGHENKSLGRFPIIGKSPAESSKHWKNDWLFVGLVPAIRSSHAWKLSVSVSFISAASKLFVQPYCASHEYGVLMMAQGLRARISRAMCRHCRRFSMAGKGAK